MAVSHDLINFDVIETQKENIQSLPSGRSARTLASIFSPTLPDKAATPTPCHTKNLNDTIRRDFETEIISISESDDPLDVYDRYVKWTFDAYPSAQATPQSQLLSLLERATKAFLTSSHYKNDPRYLKLWLHYIRFFSDSPRETFAFLSRHNVGEGLALFYEEFAAWLEGAGRWAQAEEVYKLGIQREARPVERLMRKFGEFQRRYQQQPENGEEPLSPALPTVRPALAAKIDPFAASDSSAITDPQAAQAPSRNDASSRSRPGRQKLEVFADTSAPSALSRSSASDPARGWESIGSTEHRKKENVVEARPWAGETLKSGKSAIKGQKMAIFKDESLVKPSTIENLPPSKITSGREQVNGRTGKVERVFVDLEAIYPNADDHSEEWSIEELRAMHRGWVGRDWSKEKEQQIHLQTEISRDSVGPVEPNESTDLAAEFQGCGSLSKEGKQTTPTEEQKQKESEDNECRTGRLKKLKVKEIKGETQTIKTNLESPTGPKMKRKTSAEPTMTFHTRAATDEIYDIFSQPLKTSTKQEDEDETGGESEDEDEDYTSAGESTGTGRMSVPSEAGEEESDLKSVTEWSDFTARKHVPRIGNEEEKSLTELNSDPAQVTSGTLTDEPSAPKENEQEDLITPTSPHSAPIRTKFVPLPPEDYEIPTQPFRDPLQSSQNRMPFMTPIVEKTESSIMPSTIIQEKDYFNSRTPSKADVDRTHAIPEFDADDLLFSPFREGIDDAGPEAKRVPQPYLSELTRANTGFNRFEQQPDLAGLALSEKTTSDPIISDLQCNPMDDDLKCNIIQKLQPPLESYEGFFDNSHCESGKSNDIRKFTKAVSKMGKNCNDRTTTNLSQPPILRFEGADRIYVVKRELGKGAFAPVYLAESTPSDENNEQSDKQEQSSTSCKSTRRCLEAIKMEDTPTPWEFYMMQQAKRRLGASRAADSVIHAYEMHLFADECYLIEEYRDQGTLLDLVNMARGDPTTSCATSISTGGLMDESLALFFTIELFRAVEALHSKGLLHGDLKADNCLVRLDAALTTTCSGSDSSAIDHCWSSQYRADGSGGWDRKGLALIDFGRGVDMTLFRPDVQFVADFAAGPADCAEMREMRPWTYQVDYHGLAGVVHTILFGKYIDTVLDRQQQQQQQDSEDGDGIGRPARTYRLTERLKRYWQVELWTAVFDLLLNPTQHHPSEQQHHHHDAVNDRSSPLPILTPMKAVRERLEAWLEQNSERGVGLRTLLRRVEERLSKAAGSHRDKTAVAR
ncbi:MAG: hypothetical protein M1837_002437 [Sclerophora amabilis]|nr:MAG: hypothetical protein M1837_002437 [Sclerophora amabilis]